MPANAFQNARKLVRICGLTHEDRRIELARAFAKAEGYTGGTGNGWIYDPKGRVVAQGWRNFASRMQFPMLDWVCRTGTAFAEFVEMLDAKGGYRPTLRPDVDWRFLVLAVEYDRAQERRGDDRRAFVTGFVFHTNGTCTWDGRFPSPQGWRTMGANGTLAEAV